MGFCLANQVTLTAEYLSGTLNTRTDNSSREMKNSSSKWILNKPMFQKPIQALEPVDVDVFGCVCGCVVPPDSKVDKLATRSTCMNGGCILNKLDTPKSIHLPTFYSYRESVSQNNEGQVNVDHSNTNVALPTIVHQVIENVYTRSNFHSRFPDLLTDPNQHPLCQNQTLALAAWKVSGNSILQKAYQTKQFTCLEVAEDHARYIIFKTGWRKWGSFCLSRKTDPVPAGLNFVLEFLSNFSE